MCPFITLEYTHHFLKFFVGLLFQLLKKRNVSVRADYSLAQQLFIEFATTEHWPIKINAAMVLFYLRYENYSAAQKNPDELFLQLWTVPSADKYH